jgi:hypothetical protein
MTMGIVSVASLAADELSGEAREPLALPLRSPDFEPQVLAFDVP